MTACDLLQNSGCLSCYNKPTVITSVGEQSKGPNVKGETVKKPIISEDFWTTSTCDMDNSAVQSQGSISSISMANQTLDPHGGSGSANNLSEFVNHGKFSWLICLHSILMCTSPSVCLLLWNQTRHRWVGNKRSGNQAQLSQEPKLNWNVTYESLLGSNKPFPQPIPLSEMVDFLVDIWEQEGMYD
ncbi:unnamed protein product [Dovyalis caffra]|uniref:Gag1-like clamp domain-containing protein n=1 Tax=Dovyalis caffra TaxID=77055 RepID=A0AAV1SSA1_9ROSI|nr:unnamed protein product [Dovyalis caffra]